MKATGMHLNLSQPPILVYPGAKWSMSEWIISHMPAHTVYLEPFAGSLAVFFNKPVSDIEILNDLNDDVINLFTVMRDAPDELVAAIELTPWSRAEYRLSDRHDGCSPVERARRYLVHCWQAHKPKQAQATGFKIDHRGAARKHYPILWSRLPSRILTAADRLRRAQIESMDALELIRRCKSDQVLIYADPPYLRTRTRTDGLYRFEMRDLEHDALLRLLCEHPGPVLLSSLDCALYEERLVGWEKKTYRVATASGRPNDEILWINHTAMQRMEATP